MSSWKTSHNSRPRHFRRCQERAVLRYAKEATETGVVSDATWSKLRSYFDTQQAMEVVLTVAWYNCVVRILLPLQIEHEPGFKRN